MSDWWQFDRETEPEADAARSEVVASTAARYCLICQEPISPDRQAVPFSFCDIHAAEREQVIAELQRIEKEASDAIFAIRELAEKHPRYVPHVGMNTTVHIEAALHLVQRYLEGQAGGMLAEMEKNPGKRNDLTSENGVHRSPYAQAYEEAQISERHQL